MNIKEHIEAGHYERDEEGRALVRPLAIRVRKTPLGLHLYTATLKGSGFYGWGDTPAAARAKLAEQLARGVR